MSERVAEAMRRVRRSWFLPQVSEQEAEANEAVVTHRTRDGTPTSSSTQPSLMAAMLTQLDLRPGMRVLEQIRAWAADRAAEPWLTAWPLDVPPDRIEDGVRVIPKSSARLVLGYGPASGNRASETS